MCGNKLARAIKGPLKGISRKIRPQGRYFQTQGRIWVAHAVETQDMEFSLPDRTPIVRTLNNAKFSYALRRRVPPVLQVCRETRHGFTRASRPHYELAQR
jgi:hypothetical protein